MSKSPAVAEIVEIVTKSPHSSNGQSARFWRLGDSGWGVKVCSRKSQRDNGYKMQKLASMLDLAPEVGYRFNIAVPSKFYPHAPVEHFCYTTECAEKVVKDIYEDDENEDDYVYPDYRNYPLPEIHEVYKALTDAGFVDQDAHWGNYGWMPDGRPVCVDFGDMEYQRPNKQA
jgi:hypothetical protein